MDTERDATQSTRADDAVFGVRAAGPAGRWWRVVIAVVVLATAVFIAWYASRDALPAVDAAEHLHGAAGGGDSGQPVMLDAEQARRIGVTYATVERSVLRQEVRTVAQVTFDETRVRTVSLKFDGWVDRLQVDFTGMEVRAGEPLLSTYSPMLTSAEQELVLAAKLVRDVAAADEAQRRSAQEMLQSARQRLLNWDVPQAEVERVERTGEVPRTLLIRTPYSGVIAEKVVFEGQRIMAGDPLYRIADLSVVWVEGEVFERDLPLVRIGQTVEIELEARPGSTRRGRVVFLQPTVSAETRTVRLRVALDNASGELKPGMYATVRIASVGDLAVLNVPRSAVLSTGRRDLVFVRRADGTLEPRDIVHGIATDDRVEVRSGLREGETVVASATFLIDAESNLGSALGGMGGMPGMDVVSPPTKTPPAGGAAKRAAPRDSAPPIPGTQHDH